MEDLIDLLGEIIETAIDAADKGTNDAVSLASSKNPLPKITNEDLDSPILRKGVSNKAREEFHHNGGIVISASGVKKDPKIVSETIKKTNITANSRKTPVISASGVRNSFLVNPNIPKAKVNPVIEEVKPKVQEVNPTIEPTIEPTLDAVVAEVASIESKREDEYDERGFNYLGIHKNGSRRDNDGFDIEGYSVFGYDRDGFDKEGYNRLGYNRLGFDRDGYDKSGYNKDGIDRYGNKRF